jgi:hypothetical protein
MDCVQRRSRATTFRSWPDSLYEFAGGFVRYIARLSAYMSLGVDTYPPFGEDV